MRLVQITPTLALDADRIIGISEISYNTDEGRETSCLIDMADQGRQLQYDVPIPLSEFLGILNAEPEPPVGNGVEYRVDVEPCELNRKIPDPFESELPHMRRNWQF